MSEEEFYISKPKQDLEFFLLKNTINLNVIKLYVTLGESALSVTQRLNNEKTELDRLRGVVKNEKQFCRSFLLIPGVNQVRG